MTTAQRLLGALLFASACLCGCEDAPPSAPGSPGALVQPVSANRGILEDPASYTPAKGTLGTGGGAADKSTPAGGGSQASADAASNAEAQVSSLTMSLVNFIRDGEVEPALKLFTPEHVAPLLAEDRFDPLLDTYDRVDRLTRRLGANRADALLGPLRASGDATPKWTVLDAEHANVTPNPARILFGPEKGGQALTAVKATGGWEFQLTAPLTAADVEAIVAYHKKLQAALDQVLDWLAGAKLVDDAKLKAAVESAVAGEAVDLPAPAEDKPAAAEPAAPAPEAPADKPGEEEPNTP